MKYSAGIIPFKFDGDKLLFFLGHPGGDFWKNKDYWAYLKGCVEKDENWLTAAKREFEEESGISLKGINDKDFIPLGTAQQNSKKCVIAYGLEFSPDDDGSDIDPSKCYSNLCEDNITPEIDCYGWFTFDEVCKITNKSHIVFFERICNYLTRDTEYDNYN